MRLHYIVGLLIAFATITRGENTHPGHNSLAPTTLQQEIISKAPKGWMAAYSADELVLTLPKARFLNSINPPLLPENKLWEEYAWSGDYILRVWTTQLLNKEEYGALIEARKALRDSRVTKERPYHGPFRNQTDYFVQKSLPLPLCQIGEHAVWFTANDRLGHHWVRPASAQNFKKEILALLLSKGIQYGDAQQGGADQPATAPESKSPDN